jgi:hypothetical protein
MEAGVSYNKQRLHKAGYFRELLATNPDIDEGLGSLLRQCRETVVRLGKTESATKVFFPSSGLERHSSSCAPQRVCVTFHRMYAIHLAAADGVNGIYKLREDIRLLFEGAG